MGEPVLGAFAGKLIISLASDALKQAGKSLWKYYQAADELAMPTRTALSNLGDLIDLQIDASLPSALPSENIRNYLRSPECVTVLEHLFAFKLSGRAVLPDGPLAKEVWAGCTCYDVDNVEDQQTIFNVLATTVDLILKQADVKRSEALNESAANAANAVAVEAYLKSIDSQLRVLTGVPPVSNSEITQLTERYKLALNEAVGSIQPPNFDGAESVPIDDLYVQPVLKTETEGDQHRELTLGGLLTLPRVVLLGNPGGGKTTLTSKIAFDIVQGRIDESCRGNQRLIPIVIVLRDFGSFLNRTPGSVAEFVVEMFRVQYQVTTTATTIEWLLTTGRAYVIFDGLDELLETVHRKRVAQVVASFAAVYTTCKILVTSRVVGYKQAPLTSTAFQIVSLGDFNNDKVSRYVTNWFNLLVKLSEAERKAMAEQFMHESTAAEDLRRNPLMLALMCTIYRSESYIPRNRPDIYEKCSRMLFDRWDRHRGILEPFEFEAHVEPALMHLAHTIYTTGTGESGVTEVQLINFAAQYLHKWQYEDGAVARHAAETFVRFCKGRAWVFSDVGLTPADEVLYQFTHRTFLEYFAACHLARTVTEMDALCELLLPYIERSEWDVVAQLALQLKAKAMEGGPDRVAMFLVDASRAAADSRSRAGTLTFLRRCMTFLPTSPPVTRLVSNALVLGTIQVLARDEPSKAEQNVSVLARQTISYGSVAREVRTLFRRSIAEELVAALRSTTSEELRFAASAAWNLRDFDSADPSQEPVQDTVDNANGDPEDWRLELDAVLRPIMLQHMAEWPWAAVALFYKNAINASELLEHLPVEDMLVEDMNIYGSGISYISPLTLMLERVFGRACQCNGEDIFQLVALSGLIAQYVRTNFPLHFNDSIAIDKHMSGQLLPSWLTTESRDQPGAHQHTDLTSSQESEAILVLLLVIDAIVIGGDMPEADVLRNLQSWTREPVNAIVRARSGDAERRDLEAIPDYPGMPLIADWINRRISLWMDPAPDAAR